jgi:hypothetical protein
MTLTGEKMIKFDPEICKHCTLEFCDSTDSCNLVQIETDPKYPHEDISVFENLAELLEED